jgi:hypothetical protein
LRDVGYRKYVLRALKAAGTRLWNPISRKKPARYGAPKVPLSGQNHMGNLNHAS